VNQLTGVQDELPKVSANMKLSPRRLQPGFILLASSEEGIMNFSCRWELFTISVNQTRSISFCLAKWT